MKGSLCRYLLRREALISSIKKSVKTPFTCAIHSGHLKHRAPHVVERFKPNANYFYLTGLTEPDCWIAFDSENKEKSLYIPSRSSTQVRFDGELESPRFAQALGLDVRPSSELLPFLKNGNRQAFVSGDDGKIGSADATPYIEKLRMVKDEDEQQYMRKSCSIICDAVLAVMKGQHGNERDVVAGLEYAIRRAGAEVAFIPVVAGGDNAARAIHYQRNDMDLCPGQSILVDTGCEYNNYCSDISRTFPNGMDLSDSRFKVLYDILLDLQLHLINKLKEGGYSIYKLYVEMLRGLGIRLHSEGILNCSPDLEKMSELCPHDVGHHLGIEVHDSNDMDKTLDLVAGNVVTVEPGLYIPPTCDFVKREFRGYALRIEDDILIRDGGIENFTEACPKSLSQMKMFRS